MTDEIRHTFTRFLRYGAPLLIVLSLMVTIVGAAPLTQDDPEEFISDLPDEVLTTQLRPVILEQEIMSEDTVNTIVEIPAQQDTFISSSKPDQNFGQFSSLRMGYENTGERMGAMRPLIQFDIARYVPAGATINRATLRVYQYYFTPAGDSPMRNLSRFLLNSWSENSVTWNSHQPNWGSEIGYSDSYARYGWHELDVTHLAQEWFYGTHPNYGIIVIGDENVQNRQRRFYSLQAGNNLHPRLVVDYTFYVDTTPPQSSVNSLPTWSPTSFEVSWSGTDPGGSGIAYFEVRYRVNGGQWIEWIEHTSAPSAAFQGGRNGVFYEFQCRAVDNSGNVEAWGTPQASTKVDSIPPAAWVNQLPQYSFSKSVQVSWTGSDNAGGSGIDTYDVQYRENGGPWQNWYQDTKLTSAWGTGLVDETLYELRARATDIAGNVQAWSPFPQTYTKVELSGPVARVKPIPPGKTDADWFLVEWTGETSPGTNIQYYDIQYQYSGGPWTMWLEKTTLTNAVFDQLNALDGSYRFEARATDSEGRQEKFVNWPEATIFVNRHEPFLEPVAYLPIIYTDQTP